MKLVMFRKRSSSNRADNPQAPHDITTMRSHFTALELFSSKELAQYLGRSGSMAKKILFSLQRQGMVEKIGKGPATKYRFIK